jgi:cytochrome c nitrite reductase small subunit
MPRSVRGLTLPPTSDEGAHVTTTTTQTPRPNVPNTTAMLIALAVLVGLIGGVGAYTLVYAQAFSYMSSEPQVCANCHIMQAQYDSWQKSSHHHVARCVDCHLPQDLVGKSVAKALNGFNHSKAYTLQDFDEPIAIKPFNSDIVQDNCLHCHRALVHDAVTAPGRSEQVSCVHCHLSAGHGERAGLGGPRL